MKKYMKCVNVLLLSAVVILSLMFATESTYAAAVTKTKTVSTQKALTSALKNSSVRSIKITSKKNITLTVPKGNYSKNSISVVSSKVKLVNKGKLNNVTVTSAKSLVQQGTVNKLSVKGKNTQVVLKKNSTTKNVSIAKSGLRLMSFSPTNIDADAGATIILKNGAEDTHIDLEDTNAYTSIINNSSDDVTATAEGEDKLIKPGEIYLKGNNGNNGNNGGHIPPAGNHADDPFKHVSGVRKDKNLTLEIHGYGSFAGMTTSEGVHGWYHNNSTGTDYECRFVINGSTVTLKQIPNANFQNNYLGTAKFRISDKTDEYFELTSIANAYGDHGSVYKIYFRDSVTDQNGQTGGPVNESNPLKIFSGLTGGTPVSMEIHGCGEYSGMSHGDSIHGWYYNSATDTRYECVLQVQGSHVTAEVISNPHNKNYLGDAEFEIVSGDSTQVIMKSVSSVYSDEGKVYTFIADSGNTREPVDESNPLAIFSGMVQSGNLNLEIHGKGQFAGMSYGNSIHGWYHNTATGTAYECRYVVTGPKVTATYIENSNHNKNYRGVAEFEITAHNSQSVSLRSINDVYGDMGKEYVFRISGENQGNGNREPVDSTNPLVIFSGLVEGGGVNLDIHGCGRFSSLSFGNSIHGWYHNPSTGTDYECRFVVDGSSVAVTYIDNVNHNRNYLGEAAFEITAYDSQSVTLRSVNDVYSDMGKEYVFRTPSDNSGGENNNINISEAVDPSNPLVIFSGRSGNYPVSLDIHGCGIFSRMSKGNSIHGWYHNYATGTDYECRFEVAGNHVTAKALNNPHNKNHLGDAEFEILSSDSTQVTMKSLSSLYNDEGAVYTFIGSTENCDQAEKTNPLSNYSGWLWGGDVNFEVGSWNSNGNRVHGWYHNKSTGTDYEASFLTHGSMLYVTYINNSNHNKNYLGMAEFQIVDYNNESITLKSMNNIYGDEGKTYVFTTNQFN